MSGFYGPEQATIHHARFGDLAARAAAHVSALLQERGVRAGTWVDLGCGSGILAGAASELGFDVIGVDVSPAMLALARQQAPHARFVLGSAFEVDLPPCVAVTATGEVLGYLADQGSEEDLPDRLARLLSRVHDALTPGGVLVLDLAGPGRHGPERRAQRVHSGDGWLLTMDGAEDDRQRVLERRVTIFTDDGAGCWRRVDEVQRLRLLPASQVVELLEGSGFVVRVRADYGDGDGLPGWHVYEALVTTSGV